MPGSQLTNQMRINIISNMQDTPPTRLSDAPEPSATLAPAVAAPVSDTGRGGDSLTWDSAALLQGAKRVHIAHNGAYYQLQATRQGKLILTK